ncbi:VOC family protein [Aliiglaciecola sp. 3_MG-2023]|uniref:VOC family protein n=1 Tax=Aliiglaciecola sp. 3_MG-2023 TaxID=3062644 RepID=UPI0026E353E6|nr:VOC family protein [Aliiglaciecola sp. 3_MG-2023]MDO6694899.1 VOC family protein [Aliiglaciecola sp. 3_MG-2023]
MIRLEHINIVVKDMQETLKFYQAAFPHWTVRNQGEANWYGSKRNWLHFGDEYNYLTFNDNGSGENRQLKGDQLGLAHIAFEVKNISAVLSRLFSAGFQPHNTGANNQFRKNCYFIDPSGFEIEFVEYLSDIPSQRNNSDD